MSKRNPLPCQKYLHEILEYNQETGKLFWRHNGRGPQKAGAEAGTNHSEGYRNIAIKRTRYFAHRLAYKMVHGIDPECVDHINGDKLDNRISNLRNCTFKQNSANTKKSSRNTSGYKGVFWRKGKNRFVARIKIDGKTKCLGSFEKAEDAYRVYVEAFSALRGEFARVA
jgi:hypothetical protein